MTAADLRDNGSSMALEVEARRYEMEAAMTKTARSFPTFTSDELHGILKEWGITELAHPNAVGGVFLQAARAGIIRPTGRVQKSARIGAHRRNVQVWESLIFNHPTIEKEPQK